MKITFHLPSSLLTAVGVLAVALLVSGMRQSSSGVPGPGPLSRISALTPEQSEILGHMSIVYLDDGQGGTCKTIRISDVNVQIVNGLGATNGYPTDPDLITTGVVVTNGVGNLIVGYNELGNPYGDNRTGSHNVVVGHGHHYTSFGGIINGRDNRATGVYSSVLGGRSCSASAWYASVQGGYLNHAAGNCSSVAGGEGNIASHPAAAILGGQYNTASNYHATVAGGYGNTASGYWAAVAGGSGNEAGGSDSTVSGGYHRTVSGTSDWRAGSLFEDF